MWEHLSDEDNPHNMTAEKIPLDPELDFIDEQNVQQALEYIFGRFTKVQDDMPKNPEEGDLWVDTKRTMEIYVYIDGTGWVSMTGASNGVGAAGNITTDEIDGTLTGKALAREIEDDGTAFWRPIYSQDILGSELAQPMLDIDGNALRNQSDINQFLYEAVHIEGGVTEWDDIVNKPLQYPPSPHEHQISDVDGLEEALNNAGGTPSWDDVTDKPTEFPPSQHRHGITDVDELQGALDEAGSTAQWNNIEDRPSEFPPESHTHTIENVDGLSGALDEITDDIEDLERAVANPDPTSRSAVHIDLL